MLSNTGYTQNTDHDVIEPHHGEDKSVENERAGRDSRVLLVPVQLIHETGSNPALLRPKLWRQILCLDMYRKFLTGLHCYNANMLTYIGHLDQAFRINCDCISQTLRPPASSHFSKDHWGFHVNQICLCHLLGHAQRRPKFCKPGELLQVT